MKSVSVDTKYQSTFMPIIQQAETDIKKAIFLAFLLSTGEFPLRLEIIRIIQRVERKLGNLKDKTSYINGLKYSANKLILAYYRKPIAEFKKMNLPVQIPKEVFVRAKAKGNVTIQDYAKKLKERMKELAEAPITTNEPNKKRISLWQKAELDVRYEHNMKMIEDLKAEGHDLCYLSTHPDCSERCEKWQGKLVSLTEHAKYSNFRVGKKDGQWVYSLPDIMAQTDKYGYHNNIISGFNCRHRLYPYRGQKPPEDYGEMTIAKQRAVESRIRSLEREIRKAKQDREFLLQAGKKDLAQTQTRHISKMVEDYKKYCNRNGYEWEQYRINI